MLHPQVVVRDAAAVRLGSGTSGTAIELSLGLEPVVKIVAWFAATGEKQFVSAAGNAV